MLCTSAPTLSRISTEFPPHHGYPHVATLPSDLIAENADLVHHADRGERPQPHVTTLPSDLIAANAKFVALMLCTSAPS